MKTMDCNVHRYLAINIAGIRTTLSQVPRDDLRKKKSQINFIPYLPCRNCFSCPFLLSVRHLSIAITTELIFPLELYRFRVTTQGSKITGTSSDRLLSCKHSKRL